MTDLLVDRLHVRATVAGPDDTARLRGLIADLERRRLEEALAGLRLPAGDWCVRRLDVPLRLDARCGDVALGRRWAQAITTALAAAMAADSPDVVHYPRAADAAADVVAGLASGDRSRLWAWRAAGALTAADPDPAAAPDQAALAVLGRDPAGGVHVLSAAVRRAGLPAVHRLLGVAGWQRAAELVLAAAGQAPGRWLAREPAGPGGAATPGRRTGDGPVPTPAAARPVPTDPGAGTVAGIVARSPLAQAWRRTRLRPDPACVRAWAVLAAAEAEPALFRRPSAASALALLPSAVTGEAAPAVPRDGATSDRRAHSTAGAPPTAAAPPTAGTVPIEGSAPTTPAAATASIEDVAATAGAGSAPEPAPGALSFPGPAGPAVTGNRRPESPQPHNPRAPDPGTHDPRTHDPRTHDPRTHDPRPVDAAPAETAEPAGHPTAWGGLVYLLATAPAAGLPDAVLADPVLAGRPAPWMLLQLTRRLCDARATGADDHTADPEPDPADDPAVRVLAGLPSGPVPEGAPTSAERDRIDEYARRWAAATAARLGTEQDAAAVVTRLAARAGTIEAVPGWVEFRLSLDDVDPAVRRAGLDVDPGFVPWLGAVVVIRYG